MDENIKPVALPDEIVMARICMIRGKKVMLDRDLAELFGVETKRLNEQVKRNINRFPEQFMFRLTQQEKEQVVANCDHLRSLKYSPYLPYVFTENGTIMLANVLNSNRAIQVSIKIVEIFVKMRELLSSQKEILHRLEQLEKKDLEHDEKIMRIFKYLKQLEQARQDESEFIERKRIGFKQSKSSDK